MTNKKEGDLRYSDLNRQPIKSFAASKHASF